MQKKVKKINEQNNELDKKINEANQEAFTDIICYLRGSNLAEYEVEIVRRDLTEMILSAQDRGENIKQVIGEDYKTFCDDIIKSLPPKTFKQKILDTIDLICLCFSILMGVNIIFANGTLEIFKDLFTGHKISFNIGFSIGSIVVMFVIFAISVVVVKLILKNPFNKNKDKRKDRLRGAAIGGISMAFLIFMAWLGRDIIIHINIFIAILLAVVLFAIHKLLEEVLY